MRRYIRKKNKHTGHMELQITSLADIMIIVLVFLLKSYSTSLDVIDLTVKEGIKLPSVTAANSSEEGLKVEIFSDSVHVAGKKVADLSSFKFPNSDLNHDLANSSTSKNLSVALKQARQNPDVKEEAKDRAWIVADKRAPYETVQTVLASAAIFGYSEINLVVVKDE